MAEEEFQQQQQQEPNKPLFTTANVFREPTFIAQQYTPLKQFRTELGDLVAYQTDSQINNPWAYPKDTYRTAPNSARATVLLDKAQDLQMQQYAFDQKLSNTASLAKSLVSSYVDIKNKWQKDWPDIMWDGRIGFYVQVSDYKTRLMQGKQPQRISKAWRKRLVKEGKAARGKQKATAQIIRDPKSYFDRKYKRSLKQQENRPKTTLRRYLKKLNIKAQTADEGLKLLRGNLSAYSKQVTEKMAKAAAIMQQRVSDSLLRVDEYAKTTKPEVFTETRGRFARPGVAVYKQPI